MKLWSRTAREEREPVKCARVCAWAGRFALLMFALVGPLGIHLQGYRGPHDAPFTVSIADAGGGAIPDVDIVLTRDGELLTRMKTGADGRASAWVSRGLVTISVHQDGYMPVEKVVDTRSMPEPVLEIKVVPIPRAHETVNVQATAEDLSEQNSSPGVSIKPGRGQ
jgi:hypothetical protein